MNRRTPVTAQNRTSVNAARKKMPKDKKEKTIWHRTPSAVPSALIVPRQNWRRTYDRGETSHCIITRLAMRACATMHDSATTPSTALCPCIRYSDLTIRRRLDTKSNIWRPRTCDRKGQQMRCVRSAEAGRLQGPLLQAIARRRPQFSVTDVQGARRRKNDDAKTIKRFS